MVASKSDLEDERQVSKKEMEELSDKLKIPFYETSGLTGENIELVFHQLVREINLYKGVGQSSSQIETKKKKKCSLF